MANRNHSKKSRQRERLILALLQQPSLEKAAAAVGISSVTAWRITKTPQFQEEYRRARSEAYAQTLARLQHAGPAAVSTLMKVMIDAGASDANKVRAANDVLHRGIQAWGLEELLDISDRVRHLEEKDPK
jgi:hypothetical protein